MDSIDAITYNVYIINLAHVSLPEPLNLIHRIGIDADASCCRYAYSY